jgi:hypothetical protein
MKRIRILVASSAVLIMSVTPMWSQLFGGLPVFDGANLETAVLQKIELVKQLQQAIQTYNRVTDHYNEALRQAKYFKGLAGKYSHPAQVWQGMQASDTYRRAGRWIQTVNGDPKSAAMAWSIATLNIEPMPGAAFGQLSPAAKDHISADITGIDLADGSAASALESVGKARASGAEAEKNLKRIEQDMFSDAPENQVMAVQMQHANALSLEALKAQADANRIAVSQAELAAVMLRSQRDASVRALSREVAFRTAPPLVTNLAPPSYLQ